MNSLHSSFESKVLAAFSIATLVVAMLALGAWKVAGDAFAAALRRIKALTAGNAGQRAPTPVPVAMVLATGQIQGLAKHTLLIGRDGAEWPIADSAAPIRDDAGRVTGVVLVFREVTEQRRAEQAIRQHNELLAQRVRERTAQLHASEARLQAVLEQLVEGVVITDLSGQALYANRAAIDMLGIGDRDNYPRRMSDYADLLEHSALDGTKLPIDQRPMARILRGETLRDRFYVWLPCRAWAPDGGRGSEPVGAQPPAAGSAAIAAA
jgi:PAS domain-containing protein